MWRYQIFKCVPKNPIYNKDEETFYCIKEFYPPESRAMKVMAQYISGDKPDRGGWTVNPIAPIAYTKEELIACLEDMLSDAKEYAPMEDDFDTQKCEHCDRPYEKSTT